MPTVTTKLLILANGHDTCILSSCQYWQSKFSVPKGTRHHVCVMWGLASRHHRYYVNGELLGSQQTGRTLTGHLDVYAKELSSSEIASMMELEMCNIEVDKHESSRVVKW